MLGGEGVDVLAATEPGDLEVLLWLPTLVVDGDLVGFSFGGVVVLPVSLFCSISISCRAKLGLASVDMGVLSLRKSGAS